MIFTRRANGEWIADFSSKIPDLSHESKITTLQAGLLTEHFLTSAKILYHIPDHPSVLQTYLWQNLDKPPLFPALLQFLDFWQRELDGALHSVEVAAASTNFGRFRNAEHYATLH